MKTRLVFLVVLALALHGRLMAEVSDEDFQKLQQQFQDLQQQRDQDRKEIDALKERLGEAEKTATEAQKTATETATKVQQPVMPVPSEEVLAKSNFQIVGYAHAGYQRVEGGNGSFLLGSFNPIFLYRAGEKTLFEGELEIEVANGEEGGTETEVGLEYGQIDYAFNDYMIGIAGKMLLPLGTFIEKTHPAWVNKLPNHPLPHEDELAITPESGVGIQLRGAFHLTGDHVLTYSLYGVNGPGSQDGSGAADQLDLEGDVVDMNGAPSAGGRVAWFYPWKPYSDIEVGLSGQSGTWDDSDSLLWSAVAVDAALHLGPNFEARGEYIHTLQDTSDMGTVSPHGWWAQGAYKLAGLDLDLPIVNNLESVFRYSMVDGDQPDTRVEAYTLGVVYYLSNQLQTKAAYEFRTGSDDEEARDRLMFQVAYGF